MTVLLKTFEIKTRAFCDVVNITSQIQSIIKSNSLKDGIVNVHVAGSTGAISTVEYEPGLVQTDIKDFLEKIIPYKKDYAHHKTWHDYNGAGHLRSFLIKTSQTFPFHNKKLILGSWQNIIFVENDEKPRHRKIYVTLIGE